MSMTTATVVAEKVHASDWHAVLTSGTPPEVNVTPPSSAPPPALVSVACAVVPAKTRMGSIPATLTKRLNLMRTLLSFLCSQSEGTAVGAAGDRCDPALLVVGHEDA